MKIEDFEYYGKAAFGRSWQSQMADRMNVSRQTIQNWLRGSNKIPDFVEVEMKLLLSIRYEELKKACDQIRSGGES